jgi:hypothetical protein
MTLEDLVQRIPKDTEERVTRTKERYNQRVREVLRQETGLRLNRAAGEETTQVRIAVLPGLPEGLRKKPLPPGFELAVLLAPWRGLLAQLHSSSDRTLKEIVPQVLRVAGGPELMGDLPGGLEPVTELARRLLAEADKFDLLKWMLEVNEDILGIYRYSPVSGHRLRSGMEGEIELYWGVIGLVDRLLGCGVEALTLVVLAHELGHAYTHLGFDIDGERWKNEDFAGSERGLKEGLAQYYTARVCAAFARFEPAFENAYKALLVGQPDDYQTHVPWIKDQKPEEVRLSMLETRRQSKLKLADFNDLLTSAKDRLRRKPAPKQQNLFEEK